MKLKILVGTMTSTADYVAQAIQMDCAIWWTRSRSR
jgi:MioC protein